MSYKYSPEDAQKFVSANATEPVIGGPIPVPGSGAFGFFSYSIVTLGDYLKAKYPPWGVIVRPSGSDVLVWYDASGRLNVIDVDGDAIAKEVPKALYESPDASLLDSLMNRLAELSNSFPSVREGTYVAVAVGVLALVLLYGPRRR